MKLNHPIDGIDLSRNFYDVSRKDRDFFVMVSEADSYFIRNDRFRLHEDGRFYEVPITSNETRYCMDVTKNTYSHANVRVFLQGKLDKFMSIKQTDTSYKIIFFGTNGDSFKNGQRNK